MTLLLPMSAFRLNTEGVTNNEMKLDYLNKFDMAPNFWGKSY